MCDLPIGPQRLIDLVIELEEVVGWYDLGLYFNAPSHVLDTIEHDYQTTAEKKKALFSWWLRTNGEEERKWSAIVHALANSGYRYLAEKVGLKYGK